MNVVLPPVTNHIFPIAFAFNTHAGMPLIYSGQEAGLDKRLEFFDKDEIDWSELIMHDFYKKLIDIKQKKPALWNGCAGANIKFYDVTENTLVFSREKSGNKVVCIFNLSANPLAFSLEHDEISGTFTNEISQSKEIITRNTPINLKVWEFKILTAR